MGDEAGRITHYVGFQRDVTERKRTTQLIRVLNRVLRHNLRNDVNALLGWHEQATGGGRNPNADGRVERLARGLLATSERARELERYARVARAPERLDPAALLADAVEATRDRRPDADVRVTVRTDAGVCAGSELSRAVSELVENAVEHDPSPDPRVDVEADDDGGDWVVITVRDEGPGIDAMESEVVSAGTETTLSHGSGLGLWLVNWVVTRYGGSFSVAADEDRGGTTATVRVPRIGPEESVESAARRPTTLSD